MTGRVPDHRAVIQALGEPESFRLLVESVRDYGIFMLNPDGVILTWTDGARRITGFAAEDVVGQPIAVLHPTGSNVGQEIAIKLETAAAQGRYEVTGWRARKDAAPYWAFIVITALRDGGGTLRGFAMIIRDDSTRRSADTRRETFISGLQRSNHDLEAIGRLAGGVAHDFNNLLSVILGYAVMIRDALDPESPLRSDVEEIYRAGERAAELTGQLLAFSRQQVIQPRVMDINGSLRDMERMLRRVLGEHIELALRAEPRLGTVLADPGKVEQVIMNLVVNARDAMPAGGRLTLETANVELDDAYAASHPGTAPGPYVMLAVSDTGDGMDAPTRSRIFEPFFTTKEQGKGTGLGLATVFGVVHQSGGTILVYSEPGHGSTFKVYLPRLDAPVSEASAKPPEAGRRHRGETVLLVEDEEPVRTIVRAILRRGGYTVLEASHGAEALEVAAGYAGEFQLLLTDVVMPRMSGPELVARLAPVRPTMRVLFMSGYAEGSIVHHGVLDAGAAFLPKPITPAALLRKVREVLEAQ